MRTQANVIHGSVIDRQPEGLTAFCDKAVSAWLSPKAAGGPHLGGWLRHFSLDTQRQHQIIPAAGDLVYPQLLRSSPVSSRATCSCCLRCSVCEMFTLARYERPSLTSLDRNTILMRWSIRHQYYILLLRLAGRAMGFRRDGGMCKCPALLLLGERGHAEFHRPPTADASCFQLVRGKGG